VPPDRPPVVVSGKSLDAAAATRLTHAAQQVALRALAGRLRRPVPPAVLLERLADGLRTLNELLTSRRGDRHGDYLSDPRLGLAYLAHHLPMHAAKVALLVAETCPARPGAPGSPLRILDVGAGPLSAGLGALMAWGGTPARLVALDRVGSMMRLGLEVVKDLYPQVDAVLETAGVEAAPRLAKALQPHLTLLANVVGELGEGPRALAQRAALLQRLLEAAPADGHVLIVEPGTRIHGQQLVAVRELLRSDGGMHVWGPCVGFPACPLLGREDWCHAERQVPWPGDYVNLANRAGIRADRLKFSWLWLSRTPPPAAPAGLLRLIGGTMTPRPKEALRYACGARGMVTLGWDPAQAGTASLAAAPRGAAAVPPPGVRTMGQDAPQPARSAPRKGRHPRRLDAPPRRG
jgi:hypothetical protein